MYINKLRTTFLSLFEFL